MPNEYSRRWFGSFLDTIPDDWTTGEVEGIAKHLPLPEFRRLLDVCCGPGRHAGPLVRAGYQVTGVDRDTAAIAVARARFPSARFQVADMRELKFLTDEFDAAVILWQSFGYFDSVTNDRILGDIARVLRPQGRLLLDLYHPGYVEAHEGTQTSVRASNCRAITNIIDDGRLISTIEYDDGSTECMDFELLDPEDLADRASRQGLSVIEACCWWDGARPPSTDEHRYQLVLERQEHLPPFLR